MPDTTRGAIVQVTVTRWGDALAVRLPDEIVEAARLYDGQQIELAAGDDGLSIRRGDANREIAKMFEGKTPREWHEAYAAAFDWGPDLGREIVEE